MLNRRLVGRRLALLACVLLSLPLTAEAVGPRKLVVFGDSLTDPGNVYALTGGVSVPPFAPVPTYPYAIGGFHFSNGPTWVEFLASQNVTSRSSKPAFKVPGAFTNYAVGSTRARPGAGELPEQALAFQVQRFLADFGGVAPADHQYVIFLGGNDLRDALVAALVDPTFVTSQQILTAAVASIAVNVQTLHAAGARRFVIVNGPDLGLVPGVAALGAQAQAGGTLLSMLFNQGLAGAVAQLKALPGSSFKEVDIFTALRDVVDSPQDYGLTNVTAPCLTFGVVVNFKCKVPDQYLFWDAIHPTRAGQRILANVIGPVL
jgi:phospholipase/lecithinase/hemolysin